MSLKILFPEVELCPHVATPLTPLTPPQTNPLYPPYPHWEKRNLWEEPWHQIRQIYPPNLLVPVLISQVKLITAIRWAKQRPKVFWTIPFLLFQAATPAWFQPVPSSPPAALNTTSRSLLATLSQLRAPVTPLALCISPIQWIQSRLGWIRFLPPSLGSTRDQIVQDSPL